MMRQYHRIERVTLALVCVLLGPGLLAGCGLEKPIEDALASIKDSFDGPPPLRAAAATPSPRRPKPRAQTATAQAGRCHDVPSCETLLRKMTEGSDRSWITRPETPEGLLTGVRMFALRTLRPRLTCDELGAALEQLRGVPAALRPPPSGSSLEDITRTTRLAAEVHDELRAENEARCRGSATPSSRPPAPAPQPAAPAQPPASGQPAAPKQPSSTTQPQAPGQPTVTTQPPAAQQKPQVTIPDQPQGKQ